MKSLAIHVAAAAAEIAGCNAIRASWRLGASIGGSVRVVGAPVILDRPRRA